MWNGKLHSKLVQIEDVEVFAELPERTIDMLMTVMREDTSYDSFELVVKDLWVIVVVENSITVTVDKQLFVVCLDWAELSTE